MRYCESVAEVLWYRQGSDILSDLNQLEWKSWDALSVMQFL
jgi:hypothetical protein